MHNGSGKEMEDLEILDFNDKDINVEEVPYENKRLKKKEEEPQDWKKEFKSWFITLAVTLLVILVLKNYVIINASVPTGSMENTIMAGDNLMGFRLAYLVDEPERGDIIFFYFPDDESQKYVKRIIGLPGETVTIYDGNIYINGSDKPLEEPYLKEEWTNGTGPYVFVVPEDSYLVLGDNRNTSQDARYWVNSYVTKDKIIGKAIFTYFPFDHIGLLE